MTERNVDLATVGLLSLVGLPYTLKFVWAPVFDRYVLSNLGRRRSWLLVTQLGLFFSLIALSQLDPGTQTFPMQAIALIVAFFSASQDTVVDAFRRESLPDTSLAMGSTLYVYGYRLAMWVAGGLALGLAQFVSWSSVYLIMACLGAVGILTTLWAEEPKNVPAHPKTLTEAVVAPLQEFFHRKNAWYILAFILLYKLGDVMAGNLLMPFYLKMGYSKLEIAAIAKTLSLPVTLVGGFLGALYVKKRGIYSALLVFGALQMFATFWFQILQLADHSNWILAGVILSEDLATSMATSAFVAFTASMTNKQFTATQYALLSSLIGVPRVILASPTGYLADGVGWSSFFSICGVIAIPGLYLLLVLKKKGVFSMDAAEVSRPLH
jgi:PAT family beta-lactamase induction signal transducer AmpG